MTEIKEIREEFMQLLEDLREKIKALEKEKASLLAEIAELREKAEAKISNLEGEIAEIKKERKLLRELLSPPRKPRKKGGSEETE